MEHIHLPHNAARPNIRVPYLAVRDYDDGPFQTFPERQGWTVRLKINNAELTHNGAEPSATEAAGFLQTWLYFGLLRSTIGPNYRNVSFIDTDDTGRRWLTTAHLQQIVGPWSQDLVKVQSLDDLSPLKARLKDAERAIGKVRSLTSHIGFYRPDILGPEVVLAVAILAETLHQVLSDVCTIDAVADVMRDEPVIFQLWRQATDTGNFDPAKPLLDSMVECGWCPSDVARLKGTIDHVGTLYYLACLDPPRAHANHEHCTVNACLALKIDPARYTLAHAKPDCICDLTYAEPKSLCDILESGALPLIPLIDTSTITHGKVVSTFRPYVPGESFVALSHVWAEGLGNPFDNALHQCSLERLSQLTVALSGTHEPLPLWVDTMCVPVRPPELHGLAMVKMRDPYRLASHVLVLDSYLLQVRAEQIDTSEVFARILCSSWIQRLWTLQEGRLGHNVFFQFADRAVSLKQQFLDTSFRRIPSQVYRSVQLDIIFSYEASWFTDKLAEYNGSIDNTRRAIKTRSVSVAGDEALCVACLMNMELDDIVAASEDERMPTLWRKQARVPTGLVFSKATRKLEQKGLHWAPKSFLGLTPILGGHEDSWYGPNNLSRQLTATPSDRGLLMRLPGAMLHPELHTIVDRVPPGYDMDKFPVALFLRSSEHNGYLLARQGLWTDKSRSTDDSLCRALVLDMPLPKVGDIPPRHVRLGAAIQEERDFGFAHIAHGVITTVQSIDTDGRLHVQGCYHANLLRVGAGYQQCVETAREVSINMLAEKKISWWLLDDRAERECEARAVEMLQESDDLREMWEAFCAYNASKEGEQQTDSHQFGAFITMFGALGDLLTIEALPDDQAWCVD